MNTTEKAWRVLARKLMQANVRGPERDPRGVVAAALPWYRANCDLYAWEPVALAPYTFKPTPVPTPRQHWKAAHSAARWEMRQHRQAQ